MKSEKSYLILLFLLAVGAFAISLSILTSVVLPLLPNGETPSDPHTDFTAAERPDTVAAPTDPFLDTENDPLIRESSASEQDTEETQPVGFVYSDDWKILESLTPISMRTEQTGTFYCYDPEDIRQTGLTCYYYHFQTTREEILPLLDDYFSSCPFNVLPEDSIRDDNNYYYDFGDQFTLMFQSRLLYSADTFWCELNYDTGSDLLHHVYVYLRNYPEGNLQEHVDFAQNILTFLSPSYDLSQEDLLEILLSANAQPVGGVYFYYRNPEICMRISAGGNDTQIMLFPIKYAEESEGNGCLIEQKYKKYD